MGTTTVVKVRAIRHNCVIGSHSFFYHEEDLTLSNYKEIAQRYAESLNWHKFDDPDPINNFTPKDILDQRRGYVTFYKFCPWCGASINKRELVRAL